jgi:signal peptidase I
MKQYKVGEVYYFKNTDFEVIFQITRVVTGRVYFKKLWNKNYYCGGRNEDCFCITSEWDTYCRLLEDSDKARFL